MKIKDNQSLIDIAVQTTGSVSATFELAKQNDKSITELLKIGDNLNPVGVDKTDIVAYFNNKNLIPASYTKQEAINMSSGIGSMTIEENFTVN